MQTLHEFLVYTKGWEYIITIIFVFCFIAYWQLLNRRRAH
ncbi:MAG: sulfate respiration complex protein HmcD [Sphingomonadaceae bacterium]